MKDVDAQNFTVSIGKADPAVTVDTPQNIVCGVGTFTEPDVKGIDGAELTGSVSYTYGGQTYALTAALTAVLDTLDGGATGTISYTFTPNSANYTTASGSISFSVIDAVVTGITLKSAPTKTTYEVGDTLDLTGGKITVSCNNGTSVDIDINGTMIKGFDSTTAGEKTVTVLLLNLWLHSQNGNHSCNGIQLSELSYISHISDLRSSRNYNTERIYYCSGG